MRSSCEAVATKERRASSCSWRRCCIMASVRARSPTSSRARSTGTSTPGPSCGQLERRLAQPAQSPDQRRRQRDPEDQRQRQARQRGRDEGGADGRDGARDLAKRLAGREHIEGRGATSERCRMPVGGARTEPRRGRTRDRRSCRSCSWPIGAEGVADVAEASSTSPGSWSSECCPPPGPGSANTVTVPPIRLCRARAGPRAPPAHAASSRPPLAAGARTPVIGDLPRSWLSVTSSALAEARARAGRAARARPRRASRRW